MSAGAEPGPAARAGRAAEPAPSAGADRGPAARAGRAAEPAPSAGADRGPAARAGYAAEPAPSAGADRGPAARAGRAAGGVAAAIVGLILVSSAVSALFPGQHGPASSSYATTPGGLAAYAELLDRSGHPVTQLRRAPAPGLLSPGQTVILLDPDAVLAPEGRALASFVAAGGRLVTGGSSGDAFLATILPHPPRLVPAPAGSARPLARVPETAGVAAVATLGQRGWSPVGPATGLRPVLGQPALLLVGRLGRGLIALLADASPLQNRLLASADDARLGVDLAGAPGRPVVFVESVHGYGPARGLAALPGRWWWSFAGLTLAGSAWVAGRWRRLGPPSARGRALPPARSAYLDAMTTILRRGDEPVEAAGLARAMARRRVARRGGLPAGTGRDELEAAARRLGLDERQARLVADDRPAGGDDLLVLGAALARLEAGRGLEPGARP
jgi:hypothetical protein